MSFKLKSFFNILIIPLFIMGLSLVMPSQSYAEITGSIVSSRTFEGKIEVDIQVNNPPPMVSTRRIEVSYLSGVSITVCDLDFDERTNSLDNSYNKIVTATCDMGGLASGQYPISLFSIDATKERLDLQPVDYDKGATPVNTAKFVGSVETLPVGGAYTHRVKVSLGRIFGQNIWANVVLANETAHWESGARYNCNQRDMAFDWFTDKEYTVDCNFSQLPEGDYTLLLVTGSGLTERARVGFKIRSAGIVDVIETGNASSPNLFTIKVQRYSASAPTDFAIKIIDPKTGNVSNEVVYSKSYGGMSVFDFPNLSFNMLAPNRYTLALIDVANNRVLDTEHQITVKANAFTDTCSCNVAVTSYSCSPAPTMVVPPATNKCLLGKKAVTSCVESVPGSPVSCSCSCGGTLAIDPGTTITTSYDVNDLSDFFKLLQNVIIAIAVVSGVFIIPYAFVLMASGNPDKIKEGTDWLKSIFWGYLIIFLAGALIRFVGSEILSLGV